MLSEIMDLLRLRNTQQATQILLLLSCLLYTARSLEVVLEGDDPPNPLKLVDAGEQITLKGKDCEYFYGSADITKMPNFAKIYSLKTSDGWSILTFTANDDTFGQYGCCKMTKLKLDAHECNHRLIEQDSSKNLKPNERLCTESENRCAPGQSRSCIIDAFQHQRCDCAAGWSGPKCETPDSELDLFRIESTSIGRHFVVAILCVLVVVTIICVLVRMYRSRQKKDYDQVELEEGNVV